jgi:hypothetical protein
MVKGDPNYEVGYGRPPKQSRFQSGCSGNPKGRPGGTRNLETDLREELSERILVRVGDRGKKVSKQRAMLMALVARALKGDTRAAVVLLQMMAKLMPTEETIGASEAALSTDDQEILDRFIDRRIKARDGIPE